MSDFLLRRSAQMVNDDPITAREAFHAAAEAKAPICISCKRPIRHRKGLNWCLDHQMSEETLTKRVQYRAKRDGWTGAHAGKGFIPQEDGPPLIITPMSPGWPDWTFAKVGHRLIFMELKREDGEVSEDQWKWLGLLNETGNFALVIRPSDLREGRVDLIFKQGAPL